MQRDAHEAKQLTVKIAEQMRCHKLRWTDQSPDTTQHIRENFPAFTRTNTLTAACGRRASVHLGDIAAGINGSTDHQFTPARLRDSKTLTGEFCSFEYTSTAIAD